MQVDASFWGYFLQADPIVKLVMGLLMLASLFSWAVIFQRFSLFKHMNHGIQTFEKQFWSGTELSRLYTTLNAKGYEQTRGLARIFCGGFREFMKLRPILAQNSSEVMAGVVRAMGVARSRELQGLEKHLGFLASVGSVTPYVGLFGTVWGIMHAFHALGDVEQATISMVAPGISEALVATALGLFAAIPAVLAFNYFNNQLLRIEEQFCTFEDEFAGLLFQQIAQQDAQPHSTSGNVSSELPESGEVPPMPEQPIY